MNEQLVIASIAMGLVTGFFVLIIMWCKDYFGSDI